MAHIRIGTLVGGNDAVRVIPQILPHGFESFSITFWQTTGGMDIPDLAKRVRDIITDKAVISSVSIFGNPLTGEGKNADTLASWERLIDNAKLFGTDIVTGFTGRIPNKPIPESMPRFREVFGTLVKRARDSGVRLAFENCSMGGNWNTGDWNIAHNPKAWEMMFDTLDEAPEAGLQWEPCHQMVTLIDPIPQLRQWVKKVFHVHGKDATIAWDVVRSHGIGGPEAFAWHRSPGFGDTNWNDVCTILMQSGYTGTIDIEGWHDPVHRGDLEMSGQVRALNYLKLCRGGDFIANPK